MYVGDFAFVTVEELTAKGVRLIVARRLLSKYDELVKGGAGDIHDKKLVALIAYLQRLGTDIRPKEAK